jgi:hypothetical protein
MARRNTRRNVRRCVRRTVRCTPGPHPPTSSSSAPIPPASSSSAAPSSSSAEANCITVVSANFPQFNGEFYRPFPDSLPNYFLSVEHEAEIGIAYDCSGVGRMYVVPIRGGTHSNVYAAATTCNASPDDDTNTPGTSFSPLHSCSPFTPSSSSSSSG